MLRRAGEACTRFTQEYIPNPFIFAILLTILVYLLGLILTPSGPLELVVHWYEGFWDLLSFSMQMVAILLFGYVLAASPPARHIIKAAAKFPKTPSQAIILVTVLAILFGFISWGLGLIIGAISAREICTEAKKRGIKVHYPLAAAAGFTGLIIFNNGFSASAPLLTNTKGHFLESEIGLIPITQTILSPENLITFVIFLVVIPVVYMRMHPRLEDTEEITSEQGYSQEELEPGELAAVDRLMADQKETTHTMQQSRVPFAERLENAAPFSIIIVATGFIYVIYHFYENGFDLNLNLVNFILLIVGMLAYRNPMAYVRAVDEAIGACGQIVLQFPFYAGIMGIMASSGLVSIFAEWLVAISNQYTLPITSLISAGIVNLAVPSAGGQWAV